MERKLKQEKGKTFALVWELHRREQKEREVQPNKRLLYRTIKEVIINGIRKTSKRSRMTYQVVATVEREIVRTDVKVIGAFLK